MLLRTTEVAVDVMRDTSEDGSALSHGCFAGGGGGEGSRGRPFPLLLLPTLLLPLQLLL